jgi:hypothetical protein
VVGAYGVANCGRHVSEQDAYERWKISDKTYKTAMNELIAEGLVKREVRPRKDENGRWTSVSEQTWVW